MKTDDESLERLKDKTRLDFLASFHGSSWALLHLRGVLDGNDMPLLTRQAIDRRMATEPPGFGE